MTTYLWAYGGAIITFLILDALWLGVIATKFFQRSIGHLMADSINFPAALGFYLVYVVGVVIFAIAPALTAASWTTAALYGGLFGFFAFATYDMTNYATLRDWPFTMVVVDVAWGTFVTASTALGGYYAAKMFG